MSRPATRTAALPAPRVGLWARIKAAFGSAPARETRTAPAVAPAPAPAAPPPSRKPAEANDPAKPRPPAPADGIAAYLKFLELEPKLRPPPADEDVVMLDQVAASVLEHFRGHRPGPNSFPSLSLRVLNLLASPDKVDVGELVRVISQDPALAASVLRVANSAAYHSVSKIESVRDAVTRLGTREVAGVAGALAARTLFNPGVRAEFARFRDRWNAQFIDSASVAMGTAWLAMQTGVGRSDRAFLAGLLHDVGKSVALKALASLQHGGQLDGSVDAEHVERVLERVHVEIGGEVHAEWSLPDPLTVICVRHHDAAIPEEPEFAELHLVRVVSGLRQLRSAPSVDPSLLTEVEQSVRALSLDAFRFRALDTQLAEFAEKAATAGKS